METRPTKTNAQEVCCEHALCQSMLIMDFLGCWIVLLVAQLNCCLLHILPNFGFVCVLRTAQNSLNLSNWNTIPIAFIWDAINRGQLPMNASYGNKPRRPRMVLRENLAKRARVAFRNPNFVAIVRLPLRIIRVRLFKSLTDNYLIRIKFLETITRKLLLPCAIPVDATRKILACKLSCRSKVSRFLFSFSFSFWLSSGE